jgi:hypothetical protein
MLIANVEADELIMQVVTSVSKRDYVIEFKSGSVLVNHRRSDKRGLIKKLARLGKIEHEDYELKLNITYGKLDLAIYLLNKAINKIKYVTNCTDLKLFVGPRDGSNFRFGIAKTMPYKSHREQKPELASQLKDYIIDVMGAQEMFGFEADDALGIYQQESGTIAVHCDKDIFMVPGFHYDTLKDKFIVVTELGELDLNDGKVKGSGLAFFYYQLLAGDMTDSIPSLKKGFGPVKIYNELCGCRSERDYLMAIQELYRSHACSDRLYEQADLVWICRDKDEKGSDYIRRKMKELL